MSDEIHPETVYRQEEVSTHSENTVQTQDRRSRAIYIYLTELCIAYRNEVALFGRIQASRFSGPGGRDPRDQRLLDLVLALSEIAPGGHRLIRQRIDEGETCPFTRIL